MKNFKHSLKQKKGFTVVELMVGSAISIIALTIGIVAFNFFLSGWRSTNVKISTSSEASYVLSRLVFGGAGETGLKEAYRDEVVISRTTAPKSWTIVYNDAGNWYRWEESTEIIDDDNGLVIGEGVVDSELTEITDSTATSGASPIGLDIMVNVERTIGGLLSTNSMTTAVGFRNN